jgi:hypothetical protein
MKKSLANLANTVISKMEEYHKETVCNSLHISKFIEQLFEKMIELYHLENIMNFQRKLPNMVKSMMLRQSKIKEMICSCENSVSAFQESERKYFFNAENQKKKKRKLED